MSASTRRTKEGLESLMRPTLEGAEPRASQDRFLPRAWLLAAELLGLASPAGGASVDPAAWVQPAPHLGGSFET